MGDRHTTRSPKGMPSQRQLRVGEEVRHILAEILMRGDCHHPEMPSEPVTVSEARVSPDLRAATVFVMPLGGANREGTIRGLTEAATELRTLVAKKLRARVCPALYFKLDESYDRAEEVHRLLNDPRVRADYTSDTSPDVES